jgi:tetratricopeptide (TPR) repeat protein/DNA replication protein DnaC
MRLLHFNQSGRLVLTDFCGKVIPPYAILSHRWGDSEVLLEDLGSHTYKEKDGYRKIEFCAEQAAQDQLQYFWIDTCCIDKWNLRERSKAINSMFRWYKNATKCYVFLSDVSVSTATETPRSAWEASFRTSEWFTRGWTLQELIAPMSVEFFSYEGRRIGDKTSLEPLVHEVTGVPHKALQNCPLEKFTVSERMHWAGNRRTTEEEDNVYCLLGILDIVMSTAYGEGLEKARRRLQIELEATSNAPSIIPFSQNDHFVGRESQLAELEAKLGNKQAITMAIVGPAGTGKSQLALEVAHRIRQKNSNYSVLWIDASGIDSLYRSYTNIAQKLNVPGWDDEKVDIRQLVKDHLSGQVERQCLLVFDNMEYGSLGSSGLSTAANLVKYLPQSRLCSVVFTTTNHSIAKTLASQNVVEVGELTSNTSQRMLEKYLRAPILRNEQQESKLLLQELLYLPLAIVQAAACINTRNITLQKYRSQVIRQKEATFKHKSELSEDKSQEHDTTGPVATTLLISLDKIRGDNALAADYLFLAACIDRKDIPLDLLEAPSPREREDAIKVLSNYALVTRRPAESALDLHQLVHRALRGWLRKQGWLDQRTGSTIRQLHRVFPAYDHGHGSRSKWRRLLPHARYALSHSQAEVEGEDRLSLVWKCATALYNDRRWKEAEELVVQVIEARNGVLGDEHPDTLTSMANLASTFYNQGRWAEAEQLFMQVIETRNRLLGDEHPSTLANIGSLAITYRDQGRWTEAEQLFMQVMETKKRLLGDEHLDTLTSMSKLASTYRKQRRWKEADQLEVQVMETRKRLLGDEHLDTLNSIGCLASSYSNQGRWTEAENLEVQVMDTCSRVLGGEHPFTLSIMANLASTYRNQGQWAEAEQLFMQVIETRNRLLGDEHPDTLTSMANLAITYSKQGRWMEAEQLLVQVMETRKRLFGDKHPFTLISMANLASILKVRGSTSRATS